MKTMLSTVVVALGLTFGANVFASEPAGAQPVAAHVEAKKDGVERKERKDRKRERHAKKGERKGDRKHHKGHRHARRHRHERRDR